MNRERVAGIVALLVFGLAVMSLIFYVRGDGLGSDEFQDGGTAQPSMTPTAPAAAFS